MGEIGAQVIDLATTVDTIRGTNQAKADSKLDNLSDTAYDNLYQALSETNDNVTERDIQNHRFQQVLQNYTNQSDFGTGGKYTELFKPSLHLRKVSWATILLPRLLMVQRLILPTK
ncbi:hypothetical protein [Proteus terrae]|uniref:hypothetical protein n=2 Tax=Proteus terrae TaxID=1574161 RepID=UPI0018C779DE|nr:hypothetical protein [Proteus terrae]MBG2837780.1 hypothetical protein [Proteus terrae subsp. cibarius]MBG2869757.1 hypothetical protein [Proteus terrae subsp. cibarius]MCO7048603.1 hypothetical protein [Proteus terrae]